MIYRAYLIAASVALSPLSFAAEEAAPANADEVVIVVNGTNISKQDFDDYSAVRHRQSQQEVDSKIIVDELIARELLYQEALKSDMEKDPTYQERLQNIRYNLLSEAMMRKYLADHPISDETVRKTYDELPLKPEWPTEYQARHILVADEAAAKAIIEELKAGKDFGALAKEKSTDTGSAAKDGSLGWFGLRDMVKPFGDAIAALEKGKYSETPVQTKFGWHVVLLEDSRPLQLPEFDSVKDRLRKSIENDAMSAWTETLRSTAQIDIRLKDEKPVSGTAPAAPVGQ
jgi:peptidyl-prolyl cis-trans isomerase C